MNFLFKKGLKAGDVTNLLRTFTITCIAFQKKVVHL